MRRITIAATSLWLLLSASPGHAADLLTVFNTALDNDSNYAAAIAGFNASLEAEPQARANFLPQVGVGAGLDYVYRDRSSQFSATDLDESFKNWSYSLSATQSVFRKENFALLEQAKLSVQQAEVDLAAALQDLVFRVAEDYFDILAAKEELRLREAETESFQRQLEQAQQRFDVGLIAITDVLEAQAARDSARSEEIRADNELSNSYESLRRITGRYYEALDDLTEDNPPLAKPDPENLDAWSEAAMAQNLPLKAARFSYQIAQENVNLQRSDHYPTLDLVASYGHDNDDSSFRNRSREGRIGLQFNWSLYQGGRISSRVRQAEHEVTESRNLLESRRRESDADVRDAFRGVLSLVAGVEALAQSVISSESAVEATEAGYDVGTRTIVDVLTVQTELYRNQRDFSQARYNYVIQTLSLKRAAGSLAPEDLNLVNAWLATGN